MITGIDTNILLDVAEPGAEHQDISIAAIADAAVEGSLVISEVVYAEVAAPFTEQETLDEMLGRLSIDVTALGREAAHTAGRIFASYRQSGGPRRHILADFLIAAHALHHADRLLTRDRGFYRQYFPDLKLMEP